MKRIPLGKSGLLVPAVAVGCMRLTDVGEKEAEALLETALEMGCNFFDHADIYGQGPARAVSHRSFTCPLRCERRSLYSRSAA